jgi:hypothetical protein
VSEIVALVSALAWPAAAVWISYLFRGEIRGLASRVSHLKYKDVEATFERELKTAEEKAESIQQKGKEGLPPPELVSKLEQLQRIADVSPRAAIMEAWLLIENAAGQSGFVQGAARPRINPMLFVDWLIREGKLSSDSVELVVALRDLRNKAAHLPDFSVSRDEADRYMRLAVKISTLIVDPA